MTEPALYPDIEARPGRDRESRDLSSTGLEVKRTVWSVRRFSFGELCDQVAVVECTTCYVQVILSLEFLHLKIHFNNSD